MTIELTARGDINLDTVFRVAWRKEPVRISDKAMQRIAACRASFLRLIESEPPPIIYGVTTAMGELAS
ncbi:aromatic amino acid lyase, partial [Mesorhizobium sp.]